MSDRVTGRPSGRCAARDALERIAALHCRMHPVAGYMYDEKPHEIARAALASPCCVSAADQALHDRLAEAERDLVAWQEVERDQLRMSRKDKEKLREALRPPLSLAYTIKSDEELAWDQRRRAALALLGSQNEEGKP